MKEFIITGTATDGSGATVSGSLTIHGNEPPKSMVITADPPEPSEGYAPGTLVTFTLAAQDDDQLAYAADVVVNGVVVPLPAKAGTDDQFQFTIPA